ncbi:MAG TPA: prolipoprotein diacylglyceryl transferase [Clostridiales bacterium]|nr:prolipoprotein diacylglyceryl transferase [Clostridiales bacterium]
MKPFIHLFGFKIATYGLLILFGFIIGILIAVFRSHIYSQKKEDIFYASLFAAIGLIVGAKLLYIFINIPFIVDNFSAIISNPKYIIYMLQSGFVFYGGLVGAIILIYIYTKKYKIDFISLIETLAPSFPLIHAFGRLGCFFAGCCYGIPFNPPIGMMFNESIVAPHNVALFPVQLLEAFLNILIFIFLIIYGRKKRNRGNVISIYLILYSIVRFLVEYLRYDAERGFLLGISTSQWFSIAIIMLVIGVYLLKNKIQNSTR